jgi:hypothetical protein
MIKNIICALCFVIPVMLCSCSGLHYSQEAYTRDSTIETKALMIVKHTSDNYNVHATEIDELKTQIDNAATEEKKRKMNQATVKMWEAVQHDKGNLYDLFELWKTNGTLSPAISDDIVKQVQRLLSSITELENYKRK